MTYFRALLLSVFFTACTAGSDDGWKTDNQGQVGAPIGNKLGLIYQAGETRDNLASLVSFGSATRVGPNHVLTAAHLFPDIAEEQLQSTLFVNFAPQTQLYEQPGQLPTLIVENHHQSMPIKYIVRKPEAIQSGESKDDVAIAIFAPAAGPIPPWDALALASEPVPPLEDGGMNCAFRQLGFGRHYALYEVPTCISAEPNVQALSPGAHVIQYGVWENFGDIVACSGDSGGPVLNFQNKVVGVTSALLTPSNATDCRLLGPSDVVGVAADVTGGSNREFIRRVLATCDAYKTRSECVEIYPKNTCGNLAALAGHAQDQISCFQVKEPAADGCDATWAPGVCQAYRSLHDSSQAWPADMAGWSVIPGTDNGQTSVQTSTYFEACAMCLVYNGS